MKMKILSKRKDMDITGPMLKYLDLWVIYQADD